MDHELVALAQQGDQRAFESLTLAHHTRLFRVAFGILRDRHLAEDATQQAFLDIWRDIRRLRDPAKYEGWSYRLLVRVCYVEAKRRPGWVTGSDLMVTRPMTADVHGTVADRDQLERGFRRLSLDHRVVLVMRFLLGMTPEEVGETLGISRWTVYSRLDRAVKAMRAALEADGRPLVMLAPERQESMR
jgi:RNA polymerase sigma-70 factor (ECF subfamily)